jgi:ribosomal protein S18 acetylase RimI-like enzyme
VSDVADDVEHRDGLPQTDVQRDTVAAEDAGGSLVASVWVKTRSHEGVKHRGIPFTFVRPGHEELEHAAIEWGQRRVVQRFDATGLDLPRMIRSFAEADDGERIRRYEAHGLSVVRHFIDTSRGFEMPIPSDTLGTVPRWRRRGLASALIVESMRRFRDAGLSHAALGVDAENPTGALGISTRLGFTEVNRAVALAKELPEP